METGAQSFDKDLWPAGFKLSQNKAADLRLWPCNSVMILSQPNLPTYVLLSMWLIFLQAVIWWQSHTDPCCQCLGVRGQQEMESLLNSTRGGGEQAVSQRKQPVSHPAQPYSSSLWSLLKYSRRLYLHASTLLYWFSPFISTFPVGYRSVLSLRHVTLLHHCTLQANSPAAAFWQRVVKCF